MEGKLNIDIRKDAMEVTVYITKNGDTEITEELLREELEKRGIKAGINEEALREIPVHGRYNKTYSVASGKPAVRGKDGYYEYFFDKDLKQYMPTIREDGTVDYSPKICMVEKGDIIALYYPPTKGFFGYTVFASVIAPPPAKDAKKIICNPAVRKRGKKYYALQNGQVTLEGNRLEVNDYLTIEGNAGYAMRNINFNGNIHIKGDVMSGIAINVSGTIEVDGVVEGATLIAGKNIIVHQGIHGKEKAYIEAGGTITSNFIEEAEVKANGNIQVDHMVNAKAFSKNTICAMGKNGHILGGEVTAEECIDAIRIGNEFGNKTQVTIDGSDEEKKRVGRIVVRKKAYSGTNVSLNGVTLENVTSLSGEYHVTENGIEQFEIGTFKYSKKTEEAKETKKKEEIKPLILLVDDDTVFLKAQYKHLNMKYRVAAVSKARDAIEVLHKMKPDLILLDYMMPEMNGAELLQKIRTMPEKSIAEKPVFFLSGVSDSNIVKECLKLYPQGYLIKPLEPGELIKILEDFFEKNKS